MIVFNAVRISYVCFSTRPKTYNFRTALKFCSLFMFVLQFFLVKVIKRFRKDVSEKITTSLFKLKLLIYNFSKDSKKKVSSISLGKKFLCWANIINESRSWKATKKRDQLLKQRKHIQLFESFRNYLGFLTLLKILVEKFDGFFKPDTAR